MKKPCRKTLIIGLVSLFVVSCAATALYFSLDDSEVAHTSALIIGTAEFGKGYYMPTSTSVMEISLIRTYPAGNSYEISHSRIKNIQKFPVQFTLRYDSSEIDSSCSYHIDISFTSDNVNFKSGSVPVSTFGSETPVTVNLLDTLNK